MKIEKGKLYYNTALGRLVKSTHNYEIEDGLLTDKLAVYCPTKEDWEYVTEILNYVWYNTENWSIFENATCISLNHTWFGDIEYYTKDKYHVITIDQFKQFYPANKEQDPYVWGDKIVNSNKKDVIVQNVIQKYQQRSDLGIKKYGTTLQDNNDGIEIFLNHLQEELMDATLYIEKLKNKFAQLKKEL